MPLKSSIFKSKMFEFIIGTIICLFALYALLMTIGLGIATIISVIAITSVIFIVSFLFSSGIFIIYNLIFWIFVPLIMIVLATIFFYYLISKASSDSKKSLFLLSLMIFSVLLGSGYLFNSLFFISLSFLTLIIWAIFTTLEEKEVIINNDDIQRKYKNQYLSVSITHSK